MCAYSCVRIPHAVLVRCRDLNIVSGHDKATNIAEAMAEPADIAIHDEQLPFTQLTVGGRHSDIGNESCCDIAAFIVASSLLQTHDIKRIFSADFLERKCAEIVSAWDNAPSPAAAPEPRTALPTKIASHGCRNLRHTIDIIVGDTEKTVYALSRHLCCEALPFGVAVTAQTVREDGEVRAHDVGKTFTIVGGNGTLSCFDSHVGRLITVNDASLTGAVAMAEAIVRGSSSRSPPTHLI